MVNETRQTLCHAKNKKRCTEDMTTIKGLQFNGSEMFLSIVHMRTCFIVKSDKNTLVLHTYSMYGMQYVSVSYQYKS